MCKIFICKVISNLLQCRIFFPIWATVSYRCVITWKYSSELCVFSDIPSVWDDFPESHATQKLASGQFYLSYMCPLVLRWGTATSVWGWGCWTPERLEGENKAFPHHSEFICYLWVTSFHQINIFTSAPEVKRCLLNVCCSGTHSFMAPRVGVFYSILNDNDEVSVWLKYTRLNVCFSLSLLYCLRIVTLNAPCCLTMCLVWHLAVKQWYCLIVQVMYRYPVIFSMHFY